MGAEQALDASGDRGDLGVDALDVVEHEGRALLQQGGHPLPVGAEVLLAAAGDAGPAVLARVEDPPGHRHFDRASVPELRAVEELVELGPGKQEIGRASCRERVCQYV